MGLKILKCLTQQHKSKNQTSYRLVKIPLETIKKILTLQGWFVIAAAQGYRNVTQSVVR